MRRLRPRPSINSIAEELEECESTGKAALIVSMLNKEVGAVLTTMNVRWGGDRVNHSLIQSLKTLRKQIFSCHAIDPVSYLHPFLDVIRSDETDAPITNAALSSVYKILTSDVLDLRTVGIEEAMHLIVDSVTNCSFEITDLTSEEAVLMKVLQVLLTCVKGKTSMVLSNQDVFTVVKTCFHLVHQADAKGELLQRVARDTMHELVRCIFSHLQVVGNSIMMEVGGLDTDYSFSSKLDDSDLYLMTESYGLSCMIDIFHFLCSLLNDVEDVNMSPRANSTTFNEDLTLFALDLIDSAIQLGGSAIQRHQHLLNLVQDELFCNLMRFGLSTRPRIISSVCGIVHNLYLHLREKLKLQIEAFFSCVILRLSESCYGASYQQQEAAMQALVDFCRQRTFMMEMYANLDCDMICSNVFEEVVNVLSKSAFPMNGTLSAMHVLALDGLVAVIQGMAERGEIESFSSESSSSVVLEKYTPFWILNRDSFNDPDQWLPFVRTRKYAKKRLRIAADHWNWDPKKGLEFLQGANLLPKNLDPESVAYFFRYAAGLNKNLVGDFLGNHNDFCVEVLHEFAKTFDFQGMSLDTALRLFLETFRLPGESQKIERVLEAFSDRYYEQSPQILASKDAALMLSYSIIMLNTDRHNVQVNNKMSEEDFVRNNRNINDGSDFPREFLSELYYSICMNEIQTTPEEGSGLMEMTPYRWIDLMNKSRKTAQYIVPDLRSCLDRDMFAMMSGPAVAAIFAVYNRAEHEEVCQTCIDGFLAVARVSACHNLVNVLDDLVVSLSNFTTLLNQSSVEEPVLAFSDDAKAQKATLTLFAIANSYGDFIRAGWRNIMQCILRLHKLGLLSAPDEETRTRLSEQHLAAMETVQEIPIDSIFTESKFLVAESLLQLSRAIIWVARRPQKHGSSPEDEDAAVFCLELLVAVTLNNLHRIGLLWQGVFEHIANVVESTVTPCSLVEKAIFGLLRVRQRILPYEDMADEVLRSVQQLVQKLDSQVAVAYSDQIAQEMNCLVADLKRTRL